MNDPGTPRPSRAKLFAALPRLSAAAVTARNRVYRNAPLLLADERVLIWQDGGAFSVPGELCCQLGNAPLSILADNLARLEPRLQGFESFVPNETCAALVEHALRHVLDLIDRVAGFPVESHDYIRPPRPEGVGDLVSVGFTIFEPTLQPVLRGRVRAPADLWETFDFGRAVTLTSQRHLRVPVQLAIRLGGCRLPAAEAALLAPGDALRPDRRLARHARSLPVQLVDRGARLVIPASVDGEEICLEKALSSSIETTPPVGSSTDSSAVAAGDLLAEIECDLSFELGSMRMSVADIARLRTGQTLRLGVRLQEQPVRILVSGRLVARGELAAIGDELVVVVTDTSRLPHA